jgi:hypothetical protein
MASALSFVLPIKIGLLMKICAVFAKGKRRGCFVHGYLFCNGMDSTADTTVTNQIMV